jgi:hypothetical protein
MDAGVPGNNRDMTTTNPLPSVAAPSDHTADWNRRVDRLRWFNLVMGVVHAASASLMLYLANDFSIDVTTFFRNAQPGVELDPGRLDSLFGLPIAAATVSFLYLSAFFHFLIASVGWNRYRSDLADGINRFRWVEYSMSATVMVVVIAMLPGIQDVAALIGIAGANVAMILFGWIMEATNPPNRTSTWWTPFTMGCIVGSVPWIAIVVYLIGGGTDVPNFVYVIFFTIFVLFNCFAVNQFLQYRRVGKWADYLVGEYTYIWLSLTAKSALAWQIFANTLID